MACLKIQYSLRRSDVLRSPNFGCLKGIPIINITNGCAHRCLYCYARGFSSAPDKDTVIVYRNLKDILEHRLGKAKVLPQWVSFSTASDPFQPLDEVLEVSYSVMDLLLKAGIGLSILTKGRIPSEFISLFKDYNHKVRVRIGIVSLSKGYLSLFEPFAAPQEERLKNILALKKAGVDVSARLDPIIPFVTDSALALEELISVLALAGVNDIAISSLIMRPFLYQQLKGIPKGDYWRLVALFKDQPWQRVITSAKTRLPPLPYRQRLYSLIKSISQRYLINCKVCGCKNPDLPWEQCISFKGARAKGRAAPKPIFSSLQPQSV